MEVATRGRFERDRMAVAVMVDLMLLSRRGPVPQENIGRRLRLSSYALEVLFTQLRRHKLVRFTRGREGGYALARRADEITVAQVVQCVKERPDRRSTFCAEARVGDNAGKCLTQELWAGLDEVMQGVLGAVTLQDLADTHRQGQATNPLLDMPHVAALLPARPGTPLPLGALSQVRPAARSESVALSESAA
ncbi:Rrf2 family transcriptional regulator [Azohydromonas caseinilytica]|uniref:Rrf2 family transcriptional regulator n=1 Tax=Azohydromonas caseinilytica TaxID=2728836 RepID=A0A848FDC6_9BURK|nr:Rrf2 family transcriptional regulator [Azohydromonas caseinilytica]NML16150.1 Rrf2 family transcriptional regulator [Azohydromonas caseinilytica]